MIQIGKNEEIPEGCAVRLAAYYALRADDLLGAFVWTGRILTGSWCYVESLEKPGVDSRGRRDHVAAAAELRALAAYLKNHDGRGEDPLWRKYRNQDWYRDYQEAIVPWAWGVSDEVPS